MRIVADGRLPQALLEYIQWANNHKPETLVMKPLPTIPIVIQSDFFVYEIKVGPVMQVRMSPNIGNLIATA